MSLISWLKERSHRFTLMDFAIFKMALAIFGIIVGAYISDFVKQYVWIFVAVFFLLYGYIIYRMFKR